MGTGRGLSATWGFPELWKPPGFQEIAVGHHLEKESVIDWNDTVLLLLKRGRDFPGGPGVKNLPANAGDSGSIPGLGRSHVP